MDEPVLAKPSSGIVRLVLAFASVFLGYYLWLRTDRILFVVIFGSPGLVFMRAKNLEQPIPPLAMWLAVVLFIGLLVIDILTGDDHTTRWDSAFWHSAGFKTGWWLLSCLGVFLRWRRFRRTAPTPVRDHLGKAAGLPTITSFNQP